MVSVRHARPAPFVLGVYTLTRGSARILFSRNKDAALERPRLTSVGIFRERAAPEILPDKRNKTEGCVRSGTLTLIRITRVAAPRRCIRCCSPDNEIPARKNSAAGRISALICFRRGRELASAVVAIEAAKWTPVLAPARPVTPLFSNERLPGGRSRGGRVSPGQYFLGSFSPAPRDLRETAARDARSSTGAETASALPLTMAIKTSVFISARAFFTRPSPAFVGPLFSVRQFPRSARVAGSFLARFYVARHPPVKRRFKISPATTCQPIKSRNSLIRELSRTGRKLYCYR